MVDDFAALLKSYRVSRVTGDRYAGEFPRELFRKHGIAFDLSDDYSGLVIPTPVQSDDDNQNYRKSSRSGVSRII